MNTPSSSFNKILVLILCCPFFVSAQTGLVGDPNTISTPTVTTTAEQPKTDYEMQLEKFISDQQQRMPNIDDVQKDSVKQNLDIEISPQNPGPGESVQINIQSYLTDLNRANMTWTLNGKVLQKGIGKTSFSFQNGPSGQTTRLSISILTIEGDAVTKQLSWSPVGVTVLWEADTYTPPFYKGKALMTPQSRVRAIAIPDTNTGKSALSSGNLVYTWKKDGSVVSEASGYGKNSLLFIGPKPYGETNIRVQASSLSGSVNSEIRIDIPLSNPFVLLYENDPLLGVLYKKTLNPNITLSKKEFSISAEPYFFSYEAVENPSSAYMWSLNGQEIHNPSRLITLRNENGVAGTSRIALAARGVKQTFQNAGQSIMINFTADESTRTSF